MKQINACFCCLVLALTIFSCQKEISCENCSSENKPPMAIAGADSSITLPQDSIWLDGSMSVDADGSITAYKWNKIAGPGSFAIVQPSSARSLVRSLLLGIYRFELLVTDNRGATDRDTIEITVRSHGNANLPPVACAGPDQVINLPVNQVTINGSCSTDPNNNITTYLWKKVSGPSSHNILNPNTAITQVQNLVEGIYNFELQVTDAGGLSSKDSIQVTVYPPGSSNVDIYVAGDEYGNAVYWKNGQKVVLPGISANYNASSIDVVGNDVYVAGNYGDFLLYANNKAKYWKNGQEETLQDADSAGCYSIRVVNNDVYIAGWKLVPGTTKARYWKNGVPVDLTSGSQAEATDIAVIGNDVYVTGFENFIACYWKNGQKTVLNQPGTEGYAHSIFIKDNDVYVGGSEYNNAVYWKNGIPTYLPGSNTTSQVVRSIFVFGNDVYMSGYELNANNSWARCWKNTQQLTLSSSSSSSWANSVYVLNGNVYVAGTERDGYSYYALYWINGHRYPLTQVSHSSGSWIKVVP